MTMDDLASLVRDGWVTSCAIGRLLHLVNEICTEAVCLCLSTQGPDDFRAVLKRKIGTNVERMVLVANVCYERKETYFASVDKPGDHWSLLVVDLTDTASVHYCDSLGYPAPRDTLKEVARFTQVLGVEVLEQLHQLHVPTGPDEHRCQGSCAPYPLQTCSSECGVIACIWTVIAALDSNLFASFTSHTSLDTFLHHPTQYMDYLRRVIIYWLASKSLDLSLLQTPHTKDTNLPQENTEHKQCQGPASSHLTPAAKGSVSACEERRKVNAESTSIGKSVLLPTIKSGSAFSFVPPPTKSPIPTHMPLLTKGPATTNSLTPTKGSATNNVLMSTEGPLLTKETSPTKCPVPTHSSQPTEGTAPAQLPRTKQGSHLLKSSSSTHSPTSTQQPGHASCQLPSTSKQRTGQTEWKPFVCVHCGIGYQSSKARKKHLFLKHKDQPPPELKPLKINCVFCDHSSGSIIQLIEHYNQAHDKGIQINKVGILGFSSFDAFETWKRKTEQVHSAKFVRHSGRRSSRTLCTETMSYYCSRSGPTNKGKKEPGPKRRNRVSRKLNAYCSAFMKVVKTIDTGEVTVVSSCFEHVGHEEDLCNSGLSQKIPPPNKVVVKAHRGLSLTVQTLLQQLKDEITSPYQSAMIRKEGIQNATDNAYLKKATCNSSCQPEEIDCLRKTALEEIKELTDIVNDSQSVNHLQAVIAQLKNAKSVALSFQNMPGIPERCFVKDNFPPSNFMERQRQLVPTKRTTKRKRIRLEKNKHREVQVSS